MKKLTIVGIAIVAVIFSSIISVSTMANFAKFVEGDFASESEATKVAGGSNSATKDDDSSGSDSIDFDDDDSGDSDYDSMDMKFVGEDYYGWVEVPSDWVNFRDINPEVTALQFSNPEGTSILTLDVILDSSGLTTEQMASNIWDGLEGDGVDDVVGAEVLLGGYDAYQLYGSYIDSHSEPAIIVVWLFPDSIGVNHYVAIEGQVDDIMDCVNYVESTFKLYEE